ncbi:tubulin-tyrosine ligase family protein [Cyclospora cayetanensis]|uniref:Tubulin-tyrosine ligase family protein n=1 Tax=Cyclospora cayetanensis TaxID=88456 RepID=A0A1D3CU67_9EIME|nr:tubulin-tyrosine ligase family protein [Cyclospora cayetanensis]
MKVGGCLYQVYVSRRGLVRFCAESYTAVNQGSSWSATAHLTNYAINKLHPDFKRSLNPHDAEANKRLLEDVLEELAAHGVDTENIWHQIIEIVSCTMRTLDPLLSLKYPEGAGGYLSTKESVIDRRVKEPLLREALVIVYLALLSPAASASARAASTGTSLQRSRRGGKQLKTAAAADARRLRHRQKRNQQQRSQQRQVSLQRGDAAVAPSVAAAASSAQGVVTLPSRLVSDENLHFPSLHIPRE